MRISFTIYGQPVGKGRPKFSGRYGNTRHAYTPKKTREYEENVKASFLSRFGMLPFKKDAKLCVEIHAIKRYSDDPCVTVMIEEI